VKALTEEELGRLLAEIPAQWRLFFDLLAATGLRIGEAVALRWCDVDFDRRRVLVRRRYYRGSFAAPKSRYGRRDVPLTQRLASDLEARWLLEEDVEGLVFPSATGTVLEHSNLMRRVLKPAARRAGVPWVGFHTLRHTCATVLFRRGLNAKQVQVWLGHHSPAFTLTVYVHLLSDDLPEADVLDGLDGGQRGGNQLHRDQLKRGGRRGGAIPHGSSAGLARSRALGLLLIPRSQVRSLHGPPRLPDRQPAPARWRRAPRAASRCLQEAEGQSLDGRCIPRAPHAKM
jgi:Phage integrase family